MSTEIAVPDVANSVNIGLHRSMSMSSISSIASITSQTSLHSFGGLPRTPPSFRSDDFAVHGGLLEGIPHIRAKLDPRHYNSSAFAQQLLDILRVLRVPSWSQTTTPFPIPYIRKVSGCLTNAVFFVSSPLTSSRTLLLRLYGPSSGSLISRPRELHVLHVLSSRYKLGPRIYGTFTNGRIEEYFDSVTLTYSDIRNPGISGYIGARMAELHSVDVATIEGQSHGSSVEIGVRKNVQSWLPPARDVLALPAITPAIRKELNLSKFQTKWESYMKWLKDTQVDARPVFCHNDAQYGNLLRLNKVQEGTPDHHQIIVVDFEYASPNPAAFDIANHFHEWTANYHGSTPHVLDASRYPSLAERRTFLTAYLENRATPDTPAFLDLSPAARERELVALEKTVRAWSPSSHAMWAVWGLVQAREDVQACVVQPEFDYVNYARCRMASFYRELAALGL
ncbi:kinase-like domain-containing protein [Multifurca ochricompacta]|uniref:Kinase-like domain-containing protein n=1 Tax=Multifurca ochricompacta TaxID=376703 RepID=A0AAD4QUI4_9AGAM|nr:kinase-like domain-containing protein [Multifurca ochricompacta]